MSPPQRNPSFDITETHPNHPPRTISPTPTYRSTTSPKPHVFPTPTYNEKPSPPEPKKPTHFTPLTEPFDTQHPHYPTPLQPPPPNPAPRTRCSSIPTLIPWLLFALFFLASIWYTSIALGIRLLDSSRPTTSPATTPYINIIVNGQAQVGGEGTGAGAGVGTGGKIEPTSTGRALASGNGFDTDLGTSLRTTSVGEVQSQSTRTSSFVTVTVTRGGSSG